jgi:NAD dependent epimerase/dehydratase family enzyme
MDIFITGGTGFIGTPLCELHIEQQHQLTVLSRDPSAARERLGGTVTVVSSPTAVGDSP